MCWVVVRRGLPSCPRPPRRVEPRREEVEEPDQRRAVAGEPPPGLAPRERHDVLAAWHRRDDAAVPVREHGPPTVDEELPARVPGDLDLHERAVGPHGARDRKSTRLNSSHITISYAVFCLKKKSKPSAASSSSSSASQSMFPFRPSRSSI